MNPSDHATTSGRFGPRLNKALSRAGAALVVAGVLFLCVGQYRDMGSGPQSFLLNIKDECSLATIIFSTTWHYQTVAAQALNELDIKPGSLGERALLHLLESPNRNARAAAAKTIKAHGLNAPTPRLRILLLAALNDTQGLAGLGSGAIPQMIEVLRENPPSTSRTAITRTLGAMEAEQAIPDLAKNLNVWGSGRESYQSLKKLGWTPQTMRERIYERIHLGDWRGLRALGSQARRLLEEDFLSGDEMRRLFALNALISLGDEASIPVLLRGDMSQPHKTPRLLLNSGNARLAEAARKIGKAHALDVMYIPGRSSMRWGKK